MHECCKYCWVYISPFEYKSVIFNLSQLVILSPSNSNVVHSTMLKVFFLTLLLISATLSSVPTGCVTIRNANTQDYLKAGKTFDSDRRYVDGSYKQNWNIQKDGHHYTIRNLHVNEEMYASGRLFDLERRVVYTWVRENSVIEGEWDIIEDNKKFLIRNVHYDELLYAGISIYDGWIFTWRHKSPRITSQFLWIIESCWKKWRRNPLTKYWSVKNLQ